MNKSWYLNTNAALNRVKGSSSVFHLVFSWRQGQLHEIFDLYLFAQKILPRPHMNRLARFWELFCFYKDIRLQSSKFACLHNSWTRGFALCNPPPNLIFSCNWISKHSSTFCLIITLQWSNKRCSACIISIINLYNYIPIC